MILFSVSISIPVSSSYDTIYIGVSRIALVLIRKAIEPWLASKLDPDPLSGMILFLFLYLFLPLVAVIQYF